MTDLTLAIRLLAWPKRPGQDPNRTRHSPDCRMAFGRHDPQCPRCQELIKGEAPREGWGTKKREMDERRERAIHQHVNSEEHRSGKCGPVCTYGDW